MSASTCHENSNDQNSDHESELIEEITEEITKAKENTEKKTLNCQALYCKMLKFLDVIQHIVDKSLESNWHLQYKVKQICHDYENFYEHEKHGADIYAYLSSLPEFIFQFK